jgi:hypothetical protein
MKKTIIFLTTATAMILTMSFGILDPNGEAGYTASPNESACNACHTGNALNSPGGSLTIEAVPAMNNWQYALGQTYTINVTVARTSATLFGMGFEALTTANANGGTLAAGASGTKLATKNSRTNVVHNGTGNTGTGTHTFSFTWKAPATNIGNITFYCAGNAANKNGGTSGDYIYTKSQVLTPASPNGIAQETFAKQISVYPNPASDYLQIANATTGSEMTVSIVDMKGSVIHQQQHVKANDRIELNELNNGSYLVKIEAEGKVAVKHFIKQ